MNDPDAYRVIVTSGEAKTSVKGSRFLGLASPARSPDAAADIVETLRKKHHDATHLCFAWRIGHGSDATRRAADAGEPHGTAGTPILGALERADVSDGAIAVVRWFGGTKLGTGGLIRAYGECARLALDAASIGERIDRKRLDVFFAYPHTSAVLRAAERQGARPDETEYGEEVRIRFAVPASRLGALREALTDATAGTIRFGPTS